MGKSKIISGVLDFLTAYCLSRIHVFGVAPFGTAIMGAGCVSGRNMWTMFAGCVCSMLEKGKMPAWQELLYPLLWMLIIWIGKNRHLQLWNPRRFLLSLFVGSLTFVLHVAAGFTLPGAMGIAYSAAESALVFSFMLAFCYSYPYLQGESVWSFEDTQTIVAVLIFVTTIMCGIPVRVFSVIEVLQTVCLFSVFCVAYQYGFAAGVSWASVCGVIYAMRTGEMAVIYAWVLTAVISNSLAGIVHAGRYGSLLLFAGSYCGIGYAGFPVLMSEAGLKAFISAVFLALLIPGRFFARYMACKNGGISGAEWGRLVLLRMQKFSSALKRIDYTIVGSGGQEIGLGQIGVMLEDFTKQLDTCVTMRKPMEAAIVEELGKLGVSMKSMTLLKSANGQYQLYIDAKVGRGRLVGAETVRKIVSRETGISFELGEDSRQMIGRDYDLIILEQKPAFRVVTAARRLSCREDMLSGDNFYIGNLQHGQALLMIADGMGNGNRAAEDSEALLAAVEELVTTGFRQEMAVRLVNAYLAEKNRGEHFATLDMLLLDLFTGVGHLIKYGAATTYIRRGNWMECVKSTSLPVGVIEDAGCECSCKKYYHNDLIVMVSDGVLDSIMFENKDDYMNTILSNCSDQEPEEVVETIVSEIHKVCGKRLRDDATIIVAKVMKNL